ncbi:MAG: SLBB domain-containing protein [Clostridia bacterium]|nr:SLBB domain-containing protein [Clostridia bacterium]
MNIEELKNIVKANGVVGAGGAGFPSYAKLNEKADTIILNCAECEPLLRLHRQVLEKYTREIFNTLSTIANTVGATQVYVAVKATYKKTVTAMQAVLPEFPNIQISLLPNVYPAGDEVITIYEVTGRVVPPGALPISVGVTVFNVETVLNMYYAILGIKPVYEKYVTVAGAVHNPMTLKVPLGITFEELIALAGGAKIENYRIISGGPMMGKLASVYDVVTKTTNAIILLPEEHQVVLKKTANLSISKKRAMAACCQCRMCTDRCPRHALGHPIDPAAFMQGVSSVNSKRTDAYLGTLFCSSCGLCEMYSCEQGLAPSSLIAEMKDALRAGGVKCTDPVQRPVDKNRTGRYVSVPRLRAKLDLDRYDHPAPITQMDLQFKTVKLLLSQHIGAPAKSVVAVGDKVEKGQLVATAPESALGVNIHASISGKITEVTDRYIQIEN